MARGIIDISEGSIVPPLPDYTPYVDLILRPAVDQLNLGMAREGLPIRFCIKQIEAMIAAGAGHLIDRDNHRIAKAVRTLQSGEIPDGMMHKPQIDTVCDLIARVYHNPVLSKIVLGSMQAGKTGTSNASEFIGPIIYLLTGVSYFNVTLLTSLRSHFAQAQDEFNVFNALYSGIDIVHTKTKKKVDLTEYRKSAPTALAITLDHYRKSVLSTVQISETLPLDRIINKSGGKVTQREDAASLHSRSKDQHRIAVIKKLCTVAEKANVRLIFKIDEVHWGASSENVRKVGDVYVAGASVMGHFLENARDAIASDKGSHILIGYSATPYQFAQLENIDVVRQRLGAGYVGPNFALGAVLDPSQDCILPDSRTLGDEMRRGGFKVLPDDALVIGLYRNMTQFMKWTAESGYSKDFKTFRAEFEQAIRAIIVRNLMTDHRGDKRPIALCIRAMNKNDEARNFIAALNLPATVQVESYDGLDADSNLSIKGFVKERMKGNRLVMAVTGSARMADAFPTTLNGQKMRWIYLDLTSKTTMQSSLLQSFYGRACGYGKLVDGKPPVVIVSEHNYEKIKDFEESLGNIVMAPAPGSVAVNQRRGRTSLQLPLMLSMANVAKDAKIKKAFAPLQKHIDKLGLSSDLRGRKAEGGPIWSKCFTPEVLAHIETNTLTLFPELMEEIDFLKEQKVKARYPKAVGGVKPKVPKGRQAPYYDLNESGEGYYSLRAVSMSGVKSGGGGDTSIRDARRDLPDAGKTLTRQDEKGDAATRPQVYVSWDGSRWIVMGILLRLNTPSRERNYADKALPTVHSIAGDLLTDAELRTPELVRHTQRVNDKRATQGLGPIIPRGQLLRIEQAKAAKKAARSVKRKVAA